MTIIIADRVQETTSTTGTGTISLLGAVAQYQSFVSGIGNANQTYYCIASGNGTDWEVGIGTVTSGSPNLLSRDTILASSNVNTAINLGGISTVFCTSPAGLLSNAGLWSGVISQPRPTSTNTGLTNWLNQGGATINNGAAGMSIITPASAGTNWRVLYKVAPGVTPYSFKGLIAHTGRSTNFAYSALGWTDGTRLHVICYQQGSSPNFGIEVNRWTSTTAFSATDVAFSNYPGNPIWYKIRDDGTTIYFQHSISGDDSDFVTVFSIAKASGFLGSGGYSNICFATNSQNNLPMVGTLMSFAQGT